MDIILYVIILPLLIYVVTSYINRRYHVRKNTFWLVVAAVLFGVSLFIPSPLIYGRDTQYMTHFFGGGVFIGLLWVYFRPLIKRNLKWYEEMIVLFVLVSTFGVLNELYEVFAYAIGINTKSLDDTSWDLVANTLGAATFYGAYRLARVVKHFSSRGKRAIVNH